ncbi:MAG: undecaprenyl/decaprenyl-phosphate alpha-N-acetylglucosaminyl 1-phosphate transferase [Candidatus Cloacimonetes bacterium]|nr:undecaprenyl/decaprenyl-phosphate alpha-N-acetylglucosaminyl 1-phosphate transferase [Candidatus Cloacimonadota bacterium]
MENRVYEYLTVFIMSWLFVYGLTPLIIKFARSINFVDKPEARKIHQKAVPLMGGLSVFMGFLLLCIYDVVMSPGRSFDLKFTGYLIGAVIIVLIGLIDDRRGMKPLIKMGGQIVVSLVFILSNISFQELEMMFGSVYLAIPLLLVWMVGLMNAMNFLDNMDGVISGMAGILGLGFFAFSLIKGQPANAEAMALIGLISLSFSGAVFGFLPYNFNPARIFLGDAGSMFIGYFLSSMGVLMAVYARNFNDDKMFYLLPVLLLSYAIFDIALVSYTRKRDGRHIMQGGKDHSTHRIHTALGSTKVTAVMVYVINVLIVLTTIVVYMVGKRVLLLSTTAVFATFFIIFARKLDKIPIVIPANQIKQGRSRT